MNTPILDAVKAVLEVLNQHDMIVKTMTLEHKKFLVLKNETGSLTPVVMCHTSKGTTFIEDADSYRNVSVVS